MKIKTSELIRDTLDYAVELAKGTLPRDWNAPYSTWQPAKYSTDWAYGGRIIEREGITVQKEDPNFWSAYFRDQLFSEGNLEHFQSGPTPLNAAMRCFVASKLGEAVEIPD